MRKPVSKKATLINFFFSIFSFFQEAHIYYQNQKVSNSKALQTEKVPLFDKIVRKATPLQLVEVAGFEPASERESTGISTSVVCR